MTTNHSDEAPSGSPAPRRRRTRYSGTHPKRFDQRYKELDPAAFPEIQGHVRAQGRTPAGTHVPVLVEEVLAALRPQSGNVVADCTIGYGGHALEFIRRIGPTGRLVGLDVDAVQIERTAARLAVRACPADRPEPAATAAVQAHVSLHRSHFAGLGKVLRREGLDGFDVIFADLGVSSMQIDDPNRGFSYKYDGPLDMRMDDRLPRTAADLLARLSIDELTACLFELADEPQAERIAECIVRRRAVKPVARTGQLVNLVFEAKGLSRREWRDRPTDQRGQLHPAARTFQALRMLVNDETAGLAQFLRIASHCLLPGGRIGVISFHSGEDRLVDNAIRDGVQTGVYAAMVETPIRPTPSEVAANPRSRSAIFRWAVKATG
ncbi:MAG: 16S rRNA (cytosine(1402)-N(4))-methyltransferase RsmH [Planctomycetota bacterium]